MKLLIKASSDYNFQKKNNISNRINLILGIIAGIAVYIGSSNIVFGVLLSVLIILYYNNKSLKSNKYFIKKIAIDDENIVEINFLKLDMENTIRGELNEFEFSKKTAIEYVKNVYLVIRHKNKILLEQHLIDPWDEKLLDEVINCYKNNV